MEGEPCQARQMEGEPCQAAKCRASPVRPAKCRAGLVRPAKRETVFDKLSNVENKYDELMTKLGTPEVQSDTTEYRKSAKALSELEPLVQKFREYKSVQQDLAGAEELVNGNDAEMRELAREELKPLQARRDALLQELKILLVPKD